MWAVRALTKISKIVVICLNDMICHDLAPAVVSGMALTLEKRMVSPGLIDLSDSQEEPKETDSP